VQYLHKNVRWLPALLLLLVAACGSNTSATQPTAVVPEQAAPPTVAAVAMPTNEQGVQLVARVNGQEITLPEFERTLARRQLETNAADVNALRSDVLTQLIEQEVIIQGAAAQQLSVSEADIQAELSAMAQAAGTPEAWNDWLTSNLYTQEEFVETLRSTLITNLVRDQLTTDLAGNVSQVHARHILVRTEAEARDLLTRIQNGEDFAALAASQSLDETTRGQGGDLGWFTQDELFVPQLGQTAFSLQPGQVGGPVATELGYHIIETLEIAERPVDPERRVYIAQARFENWLRPLLDGAEIERYI
jgi:parvulin-like peptidyl-prolyl isomerase